MSMNMNRVFLRGFAGKDAETIQTPNTGRMVVNLTLATNKMVRDQNGSLVAGKPDWHRVVVFGSNPAVQNPNASQAAATLLREAGSVKKGHWVEIEGAYQDRDYTVPETGEVRTVKEVVVNSGRGDVTNLSISKESRVAMRQGQPQPAQQVQQPAAGANGAMPAQPQPAAAAAAQQASVPDFADIPF